MKIDKSLLFRMAWNIYKQKEYETFSLSLKRAWEIVRIIPNVNDMIAMYNSIFIVYANKLTNYNVHNANELLQETYYNICKNVHTFIDNGKEHSFRNWAMSIMRNRSIDMFRRENTKKRQCTTVDINDENGDNVQFNVVEKSNADDRINRNELKRIMANAISQLSDDEQKVIKYVLTDKYKYSEIAKLVEMPLNTVKVIVHRAKLKLAKNKELAECW